MLGLVAAEVGMAILAEDFHMLLNEHVRLVQIEGLRITLTVLWRYDAQPAVAGFVAAARSCVEQSIWKSSRRRFVSPS